MSALESLLGLVHADDPFRQAPANLAELQLLAARDRLSQRRRQIAVLDRRARDLEPDDFATEAALTPLMFSDATYKSYPESFMEQKRWDRMTMWLQTLTADRIEGIDFSQVHTMDDWLAVLSARGIYVNTSSGTSGKSSFLTMNQADMDVAGPLMLQCARWSSAALREAAPRSFSAFVLGPSVSAYSGGIRSRIFAEAIARPGDIYYLSNVPQTAQSSAELAQINRAIKAGTARPSDVALFKQSTAERQARIKDDIERFVDRLIAHRDHKVAILGLSTTLYQIANMAKARGHDSLRLHPDSHVSISGGKKGVDVPPDYLQRTMDYFGLTTRNCSNPYGASEISGAFPQIPDGSGWVVPPWIMPMALSRNGQSAEVPDGAERRVRGRFAFIDLLVEGRWGGLITADEVELELRPRQDGIAVPIMRRVARFEDLSDDDKATCAGTVDAYIRGVLEPA